MSFFNVPIWLDHSFFRLRDHMAAGRDRLPDTGNIAASTLLAYIAVAIMSAILVNDLIVPKPAISSVSPVSPLRSAWAESIRAPGAFALELPALEGLDARYVVRRHREGGGRKDELTWGGAADSGAYVRVVLYRPGAEGEAESDPLEAIVSVAAESGINAELAESETRLASKFGPLALAHMTVKGGEGQRSCLAAAGNWNDPRLGLVVWWCNSGQALVPHGRLACLLDRLALMSAGGDDRLARFFASAELKRGYCGEQNALLNPTPKRSDLWINSKAELKLRGRIAAR